MFPPGKKYLPANGSMRKMKVKPMESRMKRMYRLSMPPTYSMTMSIGKNPRAEPQSG